jgi:hypothetical protein
MMIELRFGGRQTVLDGATQTATDVRVFGAIAIEDLPAEAVPAVKDVCTRLAAETLAAVAPDLRSLQGTAEAWKAALLEALNREIASQGARATKVVDVTASVA